MNEVHVKNAAGFLPFGPHLKAVGRMLNLQEPAT